MYLKYYLMLIMKYINHSKIIVDKFLLFEITIKTLSQNSLGPKKVNWAKAQSRPVQHYIRIFFI